MTETTAVAAVPGYRALRDAFKAYDGQHRLSALVTVLTDAATAAVASESRGVLAQLLGNIDRARRAVPVVADDVHAAEVFEGIQGSLSRRLDELHLREGRERHEREAGQLEREILEVLDEPLRNKDLAERFQADPGQVSRVLRRLCEADTVEETDAPAGVRDGRGKWYRRVRTPSAVELRATSELFAGMQPAMGMVSAAALWADGRVTVYRSDRNTTDVEAADAKRLADALSRVE